MFKNNAKKIFFNKLCKNSNKIFNQKKEKKVREKKTFTNGFKGLKNTFTDNGV